MGYDNFRGYLKGELVSRIQRNPRYSLRRFAGELGIAPSTLSEVLAGSKNLSFQRALNLSRRLGLSPVETDYFCSLVQLESAKVPEVRQQLQEKLQSLNPSARAVDLSLEHFAVISEWYHIPILALADVDRFRMSPVNIAKRLGISRFEAEIALRRLLRLGFLVEVSPHHYRRPHEQISFQTEDVNLALQHFHRQMLQKAIEALSVQSNREKLIASQTFAMDPAQLPLVREKVQRFLSDLVKFLDEGKCKSQVYHLNLALFNLKGEQS